MKRFWLLTLLACTACTQVEQLGSFFDESDISTESQSEQTSRSTKTISMLLPLTGEHAAIGQSMQNGALMATQENKDKSMRVLFFDTKGNADGAQEAYRWAKAQNSDLILGPLLSTELQAINSGFNLGPDMLSYTSDSTILDEHHASFAMLINNQIDTIVRHACSEGKTRIAALGSDSKTGEIVMNSLHKALEKCPGMQLTKYAFYGEQEENLTPAILKILPKVVDPKKKNLTDEEKEILATPMEERVDFDALIVFEEGIRLSQAMAILAFYDVNPHVMPIYTLASVKSLKDRALNGVLYADLSNEKNALFTRKYMNIFNQKPNNLASLAYDSVNWVAQMTDQGSVNLETLKQSEYPGTDGLIRINQDGTNTRALRLVKKVGKNAVEVAPAPMSLDVFNPPEAESTDLTSMPLGASDESPMNSAQSNLSEVPVEPGQD